MKHIQFTNKFMTDNIMILLRIPNFYIDHILEEFYRVAMVDLAEIGIGQFTGVVKNSKKTYWTLRKEIFMG